MDKLKLRRGLKDNQTMNV